jgi:uroporphyrinogen-III synthase
MNAPLRDAGATVVEAHPYDLDLPPDGAAAVALAEEAAAGRLAALTFTSANAVHGFAALVERAGVDLGAVAASGVVVAAVGPVTRAALASHGLPVHVEPATPRMGAMVQALAADLAARARVARPTAAT